MKILATIQRIPGGLMVVPLLAGAVLNTFDQAHFAWVQEALRWLGAKPTDKGFYELLQIGGFATELAKKSALPLIALFLFIVGSQMDVRIGARALKKGVTLTLGKFALGVGIGWAIATWLDPVAGLWGLTAVAIIAGMTNENGGMYAALTNQFGNRSDAGGLAVLSINDGPFLTMVGLGLLGFNFPLVVFLGVLLPIALGMLLGNLDGDLRRFLAPGETLLIPFFAFALGAGMDFRVFLDPAVVSSGLLLGLATVVLVSAVGIVTLRLVGERNTIAAVAGASVAGNAILTPEVVAKAAKDAAALPGATADAAAKAAWLADSVPAAKAQLAFAVMLTAALCPLACMAWARWQRRRGIDPTAESGEGPAAPVTAAGPVAGSAA